MSGYECDNLTHHQGCMCHEARRDAQLAAKDAAAELARQLLNQRADRIAALEAEVGRLRAALELIAAPKRSDGTYNRGREACEQVARDALGGE